MVEHRIIVGEFDLEGDAPDVAYTAIVVKVPLDPTATQADREDKLFAICGKVADAIGEALAGTDATATNDPREVIIGATMVLQICEAQIAEQADRQ